MNTKRINKPLLALLFFLLLFSFNNKLSAQTREETLDWLKEKINSYNSFSGNFTFKADGVAGNVLRDWKVVYDVNDNYILTVYEEYSGNDDSGTDGQGYLNKYVIDLKKLYQLGVNKLGGLNNHDLFSRYGFYDYFNLITYGSDVEFTHLDRNDGSISTTEVRSCPLIVSDNSEDNFYERCYTALCSLVKFNNVENSYQSTY